jgi:hypothetical protein
VPAPLPPHRGSDLCSGYERSHHPGEQGGGGAVGTAFFLVTNVRTTLASRVAAATIPTCQPNPSNCFPLARASDISCLRMGQRP